MKVTAGRIALGLVVAAVLVQLFLTQRWQSQAAEHIAARQTLLRQEREAQRRLRDLDREAQLRAEAVALVGKSATTLPTDAALQNVRGLVVGELDDESRARLEVRPGPAPAVATVTLWTTGDFVGLVDLVAALTRPGTGLVLNRVSFGRDAAATSVQVEALALRAGDTR